jgi:hypothetical protein
MRPGIRPAILIAAAVATTALLAACSSSSKSSSGTSTTSSSTSFPPVQSVGPGSTSATSGSSSTTSGSATTVASNRCHTSQLSADVGPTQGAAGNLYTPVELTNKGTTSCVIDGFPGVSLLDNGGQPIRTPATRDTSRTASSVTLGPGAIASSTIHTNDAGIAPGGCWPASTSLRIYPPDETASLVVPAKITICGNLFTITPMVAEAHLS